jgi:hypothetical protein
LLQVPINPLTSHVTVRLCPTGVGGYW